MGTRWNNQCFGQNYHNFFDEIFSFYSRKNLCILHGQVFIMSVIQGARWTDGTASDSDSKGPGFDPHKGLHVVSLNKTH